MLHAGVNATEMQWLHCSLAGCLAHAVSYLRLNLPGSCGSNAGVVEKRACGHGYGSLTLYTALKAN